MRCSALSPNPVFALEFDRLFEALFILVNPLPRHFRLLHFFVSAVIFSATTFAGEALNAVSKKGLQVQLTDDALELGVRHAAINVSLLLLATISDLPSADTLVVDGRTFAFNKRYADGLEKQIKPLVDHGVIVYLILLVYPYNNGDLDRNFVNSKYNPACPFHCAAFKTDDPDSARRFRACVAYLAKRFSKTGASAPPLHFIVGNEVNSHWWWYNMGDQQLDAVVEDYERAVRLCHDELHTAYPNSRVFISLDQSWSHGFDINQPTRCVGCVPFLNAFNKLVKKNGDFAWHLTTHPYPENMFDSRTWNDKTIKNDDSTPKITFKNLEVAVRFMQRPEMLLDGQPRKIVLAEQGFHSTDTPDGELIQAAALAYAYYKVAKLDGIDALIYHRHVDHGMEGGLNLGLWSRDKTNPFAAQPLKHKLIYEVFKHADTPDWREAFKFALPVIGIKDWKEIDPVK